MREVYITMGLPCCGKTKYCYDHAVPPNFNFYINIM